MKILTTTALASFMAVGGLFVTAPASAQDNQPCVGENCPGSDMQGGEQGKKLKGVDQMNQGTDDSAGQPVKRKKQMQGTAGEEQTGDQMLPRKKRAQGAGNNDNDVDVDVDVQVGSQQRARRHADWRFDSGRHQRRKSKSATFRFYFDGYWYPEPYWEVYSIRPRRVSCGEGRAIVAERFNRVRVVECRGGTYTYLGRRQGDTYRILLNARTGRIVGRAMI